MDEPCAGAPAGHGRDAELTRLPLRVPAGLPTGTHALNRKDVLRTQLEVLRKEHRELDATVARLAAAPGPCSLEVQRLKRQKLALKDAITRIEDELTPDIIA